MNPEIKITKVIPEEITQFIESYKKLNFYGKEVQTPYYINIKRARGELRALVGKGTPEEIIEETQIYSRLRNFDLKNASPDQIREFMKTQGIGIDCSGFVTHVLSKWLKLRNKGRLINKINLDNTSLLRKIKSHLRPIENIGANLLTGELNSDPIDLKDIEPGNVIRMKGLKRGHHIVIITKVELDKNNVPTAFEYTHSSNYYGKNNGVKTGRVEIKDIKGELKDQNWLEVDDNGEPITLRQLLKEYEDNGLRRLKFHKDLI